MKRVVGVLRHYPSSHVAYSNGPHAETSICTESSPAQSLKSCVDLPHGQRWPSFGLESEEEFEGWGCNPKTIASSMMGCDVFEDEGDRISNVFSTNVQRSTAPLYVDCRSTISSRASAGCLDQGSLSMNKNDDACPRLPVALDTTEVAVAANGTSVQCSSMSGKTTGETLKEAMAIAQLDKGDTLCFMKCEVGAAIEHKDSGEAVTEFKNRRCSATRRGRVMRRSVHNCDKVPHAPHPNCSRLSQHRLKFNNDIDSFDGALLPDTITVIPTQLCGA